MYEGEWDDNRKNGQGTLKWEDGSRKYVGNFKDDMRHGYGVYSWEHGSKQYKGNWRNGQKDGIGYVKDSFDFDEKKGLWYMGKLVKWLPLEENDEGQDGVSIVSQDLKDWENSSATLDHNYMQRNLILPGQDVNLIELDDEDNEEYEKVQKLSVKGDDLEQEQELGKEKRTTMKAHLRDNQKQADGPKLIDMQEEENKIQTVTKVQSQKDINLVYVKKFDQQSKGADGRLSRRSGGLSSYITGRSRPIDDAKMLGVKRNKLAKKKKSPDPMLDNAKPVTTNFQKPQLVLETGVINEKTQIALRSAKNNQHVSNRIFNENADLIDVNDLDSPVFRDGGFNFDVDTKQQSKKQKTKNKSPAQTKSPSKTNKKAGGSHKKTVSIDKDDKHFYFDPNTPKLDGK